MNLTSIENKIKKFERLSFEDGVELFNCSDIVELGRLADLARSLRLKDKHKKDCVYWINNHHLNLTNICEGSCKFCAYSKNKGDLGSFFIPVEEAIEYVKKHISSDVSEIHIVSGLNPDLNLEYYSDLFSGIKNIVSDCHIQALTAVEVEYISKLEGMSIEQVLNTLKNAGLGSLPGGGAEIFAQEIRQKVCPEKISGDRWIEVMYIAHNLGIKSNATMLTGIGENDRQKVEHILKIRELQDKTGGFMSFIPLFCHYENTQLPPMEKQTGVEILRTYAVSRLLLDNIEHLKTFWIQVGISLSQLALHFGADDIDGTVVKEKITHDAGANTSQAMSKEELLYLIKNAGKIPVERGTLYDII